MRGGEGGLRRNRYMTLCVKAFCELFSINSPLTHGHALDCGMSARQICAPIKHETKGAWVGSLFVFYVSAERNLFLSLKIKNIFGRRISVGALRGQYPRSRFAPSHKMYPWSCSGKRIIMKPFSLRKQTNHTNPIKPYYHSIQKAD